MNTSWAPKPLRPQAQNPLFEVVEPKTVVKGMSPMERQRYADGTPYTTHGASGLRPADAKLVLREDLVKKGSLVEKYDERPKMPKQQPEDPITVVKAYMAFKSKEEVEASKQMAKSLDKMNAAIADFAAKAGVKAGS